MRRDWLRLAVLDRGTLTPEQLERIEKWPELHDRSLAERLYRSGLVSDEQLLGMLVEQGAGDATAELSEGLAKPAVLGAMDRDLANRTRAIPLRLNPPRLVVGMLDPSDTEALERIAFYSGLLVEPRAVRASVLFQALADAYNLPMVNPDPTAASGEEGNYTFDEISDTLPAPSGNVLEAVTTGRPPPDVRRNTPTADPATSPLAAEIARMTEGVPAYAEPPSGQPPTFGWLRSEAPATPAVAPPPTTTQTNPIAMRDTIPPQVLPQLAAFRVGLLFLVRGDVAVGWDGVGDGVDTVRVRDVLLPLTAPSAFARAWSWRMVAAGNPAEPSTIERIFFRFLGASAPSAFVVVPVRVGEDVVALIYVDLAEGSIGDDRLTVVRQVGFTLADALAPLVAEGTLFGPV